MRVLVIVRVIIQSTNIVVKNLFHKYTLLLGLHNNALVKSTIARSKYQVDSFPQHKKKPDGDLMYKLDPSVRILSDSGSDRLSSQKKKCTRRVISDGIRGLSASSHWLEFDLQIALQFLCCRAKALMSESVVP